MSGTPDLSALLKGKLQLLKKSTTKDPSTKHGDISASPKERSEPLDQAVSEDHPTPEPAKKKPKRKRDKKKVPEDESALGGGHSDGSLAKKKKKKKRPREDPVDSESREERTEGVGTAGLTDETLEKNPKKKPKRKGNAKKDRQPSDSGSAPAHSPSPPRPGDEVAVQSPPERSPPADARVTSKSPSGTLALPAQSSGSAPARASVSESSLGKRPRIDFSDRVEFLYNEQTPLVCNPGQCAELSRQIRGGPREMPPVSDLVFKDDYIEMSLMNRRVRF
ncbi:hypothetical protein Bca101_061102 [Brassica carinata]